MSDSRAQTGVRSLLARFENNNNNSNNNNASTSPPSRGRSPIDHDHPGSVRPLSKVRASFVAVERTGQSGSAPMWGLRKASDLDSNGSTNNSPGKLTRTMSGGVDDVGSPMERSVTVASSDSADKGALSGRSLAASPPDNNNIHNNNANRNNGGLPGSGDINRPWAAKLPSRFTDSPTPGKQSTPGDTLMAGTATTELKPESGNIESKGNSKDDKPHAKEVAPVSSTRMNGKSTDKTAPKKTKSSMNPPLRPANIIVKKDANNTTSKKSSSNGLKSPLPRTPRTPTATTSNPSAKSTPKETDRSRTATTKQPVRATAGKTTTKPQSSVPPRDKITKPSSDNPPSTRNRPRTRSPTRPVRLPNSMIAPTASSAAKLNLDGRPASQAGTRTSNLTRKPSSLRSDRNTVSSRASRPAAASTAQKQSTRASSLAPQQSTAHERPRSRVSNIGGTRPADESFLARMMRPTASSASKMHEKIEIKSPSRGSGPPKVRRKSGESASSHASMSASLTASTPPSLKKKGVVKPSQALPSNVDVEPRKHPEPDAIQALAQAQPAQPGVTTTAAPEVEIATQEPEPEAPLEREAEAEPEKPAATEPVVDAEPAAHSEPTVAEPSTTEPAVTVHLTEPEPEPEPVSEPIVPNPATTELVPTPLPEITEVSIVEEDPAKVPLPEGTEQVEL
ncbi:hypothetical protein ACJ72_06061 [Emergomyces africanus]|uniref:Uncharacterized protein n=1 Tax=Emergomyces africanus TaxID=1955775 RepID=A0A1B7NS43_9EURO|nr:hypothetical protein ACJ72_06061 [Emergomyces africanus]